MNDAVLEALDPDAVVETLNEDLDESVLRWLEGAPEEFGPCLLWLEGQLRTRPRPGSLAELTLLAGVESLLRSLSEEAGRELGDCLGRREVALRRSLEPEPA